MSWLQAAKDLGIKITSPFILTSDGNDFIYIALIHDFGADKGTLVCTIDQWQSYVPIATRQGFYCSGLADVYIEYDRNRFVDTLDDWGWYGAPEAKPAWYTGKPWA